MPIIFLTGHGDIPMGVQAMKAGAVEFLTKPCRDQDLLDSVRLALARDRERREGAARLAGLKADFATLTGREKEVIGLVTAGLLNKQIAAEMGVSEVTVKMHRGNIMRTMHARTLADLIRMADLFGRHARQAWITLDLSILFFALPIAQLGKTQRSTRESRMAFSLISAPGNRNW
jgi:FixJ family two-component response regulator